MGYLPPDPSADDAESVLASLELTVTRRLSGRLLGDYRGMLPGTGSELSDTRGYEPGDDVRRIDWAATARTGEVQLRQTIEDRELTCYLVGDASASLDFGTRSTSKRYVAAAALASWGFLAARGANRVGGGVASGSWRWYPPTAGRQVTRALITDFLNHAGTSGRVDLAAALVATGRLARHRGLVTVVSDFAGPLDWDRALAALSVRHDVVAVEVSDPREQQLSDVGLVAFQDLETGRERWVDTSSAGVRGRYAHERARRRAEVHDAVRSAGAELVVLDTVGDWVDGIVEHLRRRRLAVAATGTRR